MAAILEDIKENGLPEIIDRNSMRAARDAVTTSVGAYGPIVQSIECIDNDGGTQHIPVACPFASLSAAVEESSTFRSFFKQQLLLNPPSPDRPWNIIL